jgi:hypothetical protein
MFDSRHKYFLLALIVTFALYGTKCRDTIDYNWLKQYDTGLGFNIGIRNWSTVNNEPCIVVYQIGVSEYCHEPLSYFTEYDRLISSSQLDSFRIEVILEHRITNSVDTFRLKAHEAIIEKFRKIDAEQNK